MAQAPLYQLTKVLSGTWSGTDFMYTTSAAEARNAISQGYTLQGVCCTAYDAAATDLVEFQRYTRNGFHFYTTNPAGESLSGWTRVTTGTPIYLPNPTGTQPANTVVLARYASAGQTGVGHFFTADAAGNAPPAGWTLEPAGRTGWVGTGTNVTFQVTYNGNGQSSGIAVTGGNAVGQQVTIGSTTYTLDATDALVAYGVGNWIRFAKNDAGRWHFKTLTVAPADPSTPSNEAAFEVFLDADEKGLDLVDEDLDNTDADIAYKYTLTIFDEATDKDVPFDPKIINRAPSTPGGV